MKDTEAREDIRRLKLDLEDLWRRWTELNLCVKDCPKCGHETIQREGQQEMRYKEGIGFKLILSGSFNYQCLNCGTKFLLKQPILEEVKNERP